MHFALRNFLASLAFTAIAAIVAVALPIAPHASIEKTRDPFADVEVYPAQIVADAQSDPQARPPVPSLR